jgi:hypothetical protein
VSWGKSLFDVVIAEFGEIGEIMRLDERICLGEPGVPNTAKITSDNRVRLP